MRTRTISVIDFIKERDQWRQDVMSNPIGIIVDPGDEIVCDRCNDDIVEDPLTIVGSYLLCGKCRRKNGEK